MKPKNFNQLKNFLQVGQKIKLVGASDKNHRYLNTERIIIHKQTNAVKLEGGSWLGLGSTGEKANEFTFQENGFTYEWDKGTGYAGFLKYEYIS